MEIPSIPSERKAQRPEAVLLTICSGVSKCEKMTVDWQMTSGKTCILVALLSIAKADALAHTGATGILLERMNGMTAMRDVIGELAPMMQRAVPYDAVTLSEGGAVIASRAGATMLSLFSDGSLEGKTFAKPEI